MSQSFAYGNRLPYFAGPRHRRGLSGPPNRSRPRRSAKPSDACGGRPRSRSRSWRQPPTRLPRGRRPREARARPRLRFRHRGKTVVPPDSGRQVVFGVFFRAIRSAAAQPPRRGVSGGAPAARDRARTPRRAPAGRLPAPTASGTSGARTTGRIATAAVVGIAHSGRNARCIGGKRITRSPSTRRRCHLQPTHRAQVVLEVTLGARRHRRPGSSTISATRAISADVPVAVGARQPIPRTRGTRAGTSRPRPHGSRAGGRDRRRGSAAR